MGAISFVARRRLARRAWALAGAGIVLGLAFGLSFGSFAAARHTASAYDRILTAADGADAAVSHGQGPAESAASIGRVAGIVRQRAYAGFVGSAEGVDPAYATGLLAPIADEFPLDLPLLHAGRLPDPDAADEVFVSKSAADGAGLVIGDRLEFTLFNRDFTDTEQITASVVGIGTLAPELVTDETTIFGVMVFSRAFYEQHRDLVIYSVSNIYLAPGVDLRSDVAGAVTALGHEMQSVRTQEQHAVNDALRPIIIILVALGTLAFAAALALTAQVMVRDRERWQVESRTLRGIGLSSRQLRGTRLVNAAVVAAVAVPTALAFMLVVSPVAPIGPLHDFDPDQGYALDTTIAAAGTIVIVILLASLAIGLPAGVRRKPALAPIRTGLLAVLGGRPGAFSGVTLALRSGAEPGRPWRAVSATVVATALLGLVATFAASAVTLSDTPSRYGFDADLLAINQYGDQAESALEDAFAHADVVGATGYTTASLLVDGRSAPGLAMTPVVGTLTPTILRGEAPRTDAEIVLGQDTLDEIDADIGDVVPVQLSAYAGNGDTEDEIPDAIDLRVVGVATFPPVFQAGTDVARLGIGALVTRGAYVAMGGDPGNDPEFTTVKVEDGIEPAAVRDRAPRGFADVTQTTTHWFENAKPAELRQLDTALPYVRGALFVGLIIVLAVLSHALWTRVRANRHELAVLRALGSTRRQLDEVTAWQAAPFALAALVIGLPIGIVLGRMGFSQFARSLAVVDDATTSLTLVAALLGAVVIAIAIATLVSVAIARRRHPAALLRDA